MRTPAPQPRDRHVAAKQALRRELAERHDDLRLHRVDLAEQERLALRHLVRLGLRLPGGRHLITLAM
jgi:hypothetical protein